MEPQFTRRYINHANNEALVRRIQHSFDRAAWEKDFAIIEGTGHAGVGSVFDLSTRVSPASSKARWSSSPRRASAAPSTKPP